MSEEEENSPTCQALRLGGTCCFSITMFFAPFSLFQFGLIKCHPAFALASLVILPPACFYLMWLMALEYLMCVIAWFIGCTIQLFTTFFYLVRRRYQHGPAWLTKTPDDLDTCVSAAHRSLPPLVTAGFA